MRLIPLILLVLIIYGCNQPTTSINRKQLGANEEKSTNKPFVNQPVKQEEKTESKFSFFTHLQPEGWGYYIMENGKRIIDQQTIPGASGNLGFETSEDAQKVAELVIRKLESGNFPPTVTEEELGKLGISFMK
jgi:hypothetical protein